MALSNVYVDLSQNPLNDDFLSGATRVDVSPNEISSYTDPSGNLVILSNYYYWIYEADGQFRRSEIPPNVPNSQTPLEAERYVAGSPIYQDYSQPKPFAAINATANELTYLKISLESVATGISLESVATGFKQLIFVPKYTPGSPNESDLLPVVFNLNAASDWTTLPGLPNIYGDFNALPGQIEARVVESNGTYAVVARSVSISIIDGIEIKTVNPLNGSQMSSILQSFNFASSDETAQQTAFTFKVEVTDIDTLEIPPEANWVGSNGFAGAADTTVVYFDSLGPAASDLIVSGNTLILAMNGNDWPSNFTNAPSQVAESAWQKHFADNDIIPFLSVTDGEKGAVEIIDIQSFWNGYQITLASPVSNNVVLSYQPDNASVDQISGVIQDQTGNDANAFVIRASHYLSDSAGLKIDATRLAFNNAAEGNSDGIYFLSSNLDSDQTSSIEVQISGSNIVVIFDYAFREAGTAGVNFYKNSSNDAWVKQVATISGQINTGSIDQGIYRYTPAQFREIHDSIISQVTRFDSVTIDAVGGVGASASSAVKTNNIERIITELKPATQVPMEVLNSLGRLAYSIGNDAYNTGTGNDTIDGGAGNDTLNSGAGNDVLIGGFGNDSLLGGAGNDRYVLGLQQGSDRITDAGGVADVLDLRVTNGNGFTLDGGEGVDELIGGIGNDTYYVDNANDIIKEYAIDNTQGQEIFSLGNYNDVIVTTTSFVLSENVTGIEDVMVAGALTGSESFNFDPINLTGNSLAQGLIGNDGINTLSGLGGDDALVGMAGNDVLYGGDGNDALFGGLGDDLLYGDRGDDTFIFNFGSSLGTNLIGEYGPVILTGGNDLIDGGDDIDTIFLRGSLFDYDISKNSGTDFYTIRSRSDGTASPIETATFRNIEQLAFGANLNDYFSDPSTATNYSLSSFTFASDNSDALSAPSSADWIIFGGAGNDKLNGDIRNDTIDGGAGDDTLNSGAGNDVLIGGFGNDSLLGGAGNDRYVLGLQQGRPQQYRYWLPREF